MNKQDTINKIIDYLKDNEELFNEIIEDLDSYNGYLGDDHYYDMEYLDDFFYELKPLDILYKAFYGRDDESWETNSSSNKIYGEFNPNRNYFYFNGYGNLVSCGYKDYSDKLDNYFIDALIENKDNLYSVKESEELTELLEELEEAENEL